MTLLKTLHGTLRSRLVDLRLVHKDLATGRKKTERIKYQEGELDGKTLQELEMEIARAVALG